MAKVTTSLTVPFEVAFRRVESRPEVQAEVAAQVAKLEQFCRRILHCRVMVEAPHPRRRTGNVHHVRVDLSLPGSRIVVRRDPPAHQAHEDLGLAIRDAFHAARRQLEDYVRERRHLVKVHEAPPHGRVVRLLPDDGYGFLAGPDGSEVYFHRDSVLGGRFARLRVGDEVRYAEEAGEKGPQASTVVPVGRHHHETRAPTPGFTSTRTHVAAVAKKPSSSKRVRRSVRTRTSRSSRSRPDVSTTTAPGAESVVGSPMSANRATAASA